MFLLRIEINHEYRHYLLLFISICLLIVKYPVGQQHEMPRCLCFSKRFTFQVFDSFDYDRSNSDTYCHIVATLQNIHNGKLQDKNQCKSSFYIFKYCFWERRQAVCVILHVHKQMSANMWCCWGHDVQHWSEIH